MEENISISASPVCIELTTYNTIIVAVVTVRFVNDRFGDGALPRQQAGKIHGPENIATLPKMSWTSSDSSKVTQMTTYV